MPQDTISVVALRDHVVTALRAMFAKDEDDGDDAGRLIAGVARTNDIEELIDVLLALPTDYVDEFVDRVFRAITGTGDR